MTIVDYSEKMKDVIDFRYVVNFGGCNYSPYINRKISSIKKYKTKKSKKLF